MSGIRMIPACSSSRLAAWLVDTAITVALMAGTMYYLADTTDIAEFLLQTNYTQLATVVVVPTTIHLLFMSLNCASIGMYMMDLQMVQADQSPPTASNLIRRPMSVLLLLALAFLSVFVPFLNEQRRTVGDFVSRTRVVESLAPGHKISYDVWRIFKAALKQLGPVFLALSIAVFLLNKDAGPNKDTFLRAVTSATTATLLVATIFAAMKVKVTRVRLSTVGIQRSGWFGWSGTPIKWGDIDYAQARVRGICPYFEIHKLNHRRFKVPIERSSAQLTALTLLNHGVRMEQ